MSITAGCCPNNLAPTEQEGPGDRKNGSISVSRGQRQQNGKDTEIEGISHLWGKTGIRQSRLERHPLEHIERVAGWNRIEVVKEVVYERCEVGTEVEL